MDTIPQDTPQKQCTGACQRVLPTTTDFFHKNRNGLYSCCKECRNKKLKIYNDAHVEAHKTRYQEHKEEVLAKQREYREANPQKVKERKRQSYQNHREEIRVKSGDYRKVHREEINEQRKHDWREDRSGVRTQQLQHYQEHHEEILANAARYRNANREEISRRQRLAHQKDRALHLAKRRVHKQRRRARLRNLEGTLIVQQIIGKLKAQHYACYYCFRKFEQCKDGTYIYHIDHTIPISRPELTPRHDANYVVLACPPCNQSKNDKSLNEWTEGGRLF